MSPLLPDTVDDSLMSALSRKDLYRLSQTSKDFQRRVDAYWRRVANIEKFLNKYFTPSEVPVFRYLQSLTQMVISGSTALQFFERVEYPSSDLDIYVEHDHKEEIVRWLLQIGYVFESRRNMTLAEEMNFPPPNLALNDPRYIGRGVSNVYNFHKYGPDRKIQLITSKRSPLEIILNYHSTCVMNIITHEKAYSFYPKATFEDRFSLKHSTAGVNQEEARQKYTRRGWAMIDRLSPGKLAITNSEFTIASRYVGDPFCWTINLTPKIVLPEALVEINSWEFRCGGDISSMSVRYCERDKLRFKYLNTSYGIYDFIKLSLYYEPEGQHDARILQLLRNRRITLLDSQSRH